MPLASLTLTLKTVLGSVIDCPVRVNLTPEGNSAGGQHMQTPEFQLNGAGTCRINAIPALDSGTVYRVEVDARNYQTLSFFQRMIPGDQAADPGKFLINPSKVKGLAAPKFDGLENPHLKEILSASQIPQLQSNGAFLQGEELYEKFSDPQKACLLNIAAKASHWSASNVWPLVRSIVRIEQDRFFALVDDDTKKFFENKEKPVRFASAGKALHTPMPGFQLDSSFKSNGTHATLQVTLMKSTSDSTWAADIDIDENSGVEHAFEVIRNSFKGLTNPYQVHELMLLGEPDEHRGETVVDPGYKLLLA